ncbi:MAG: CvpA family protein [Clostridia bacterium]|nr:CvpA family protein [Clostridia bacterium]
MNYISLIIDLIMVLIFAVFIINGRKRGFINTALSLAASAIAIFVAYKYAMPVAQWADGAFIKSAAVNTFSEAISVHLSSGAQAVIDAVPSYITEAAEAGGVSLQELISGIGSTINAEQAAEQIYGAIYSIIILPVLTVVAFLAIYAIISFILSFAVKAIDKVFKLPGLKGLNKTLGGLLGAVKGVAAVAILCAVLVTFRVFIQPEFLATAIDEAMIPGLIAEILK